VPLLWKVLANKYSGKLELAAHWDEDGETARDLGFDDTTKVLIYPAGRSKPVKYDGIVAFLPMLNYSSWRRIS
jgi:protein disulfide-isomerase A6